ncbi:MAG TPA: 5,6-dimethylbenzimidazole synthase, partial [Streptomyces sp.]|nr:5,6-dimethylbenzimidazole synthase [Streptomyces sp.]
MTDTGQIPGEGQPENAGGQPEQPGTPAPGTYTFADPAEGVATGDEDDLLLPGSQGAWGEAMSVPPAPVPYGTDGRGAVQAPHSAARHPQRPGPHPTPSGQSEPQRPAAQTTHVQVTQATQAPRRPLHLGPPVPEQSGAVRSLADRGPTPAAPTGAGPVTPAVPVPTPPQGVPVRQPGPPTMGPEYFEVAHEEPTAPESSAAPASAPHVPPAPPAPAPAPAGGPATLPGPQPGAFPAEPVQPGAWGPQPPAPVPAEAQAGQPAEAPLPGPDLAAAPAPAGENVPPAPPRVQAPAAPVVEPPSPAPVPEPLAETPAEEPSPEASGAPGPGAEAVVQAAPNAQDAQEVLEVPAAPGVPEVPAAAESQAPRPTAPEQDDAVPQQFQESAGQAAAEQAPVPDAPKTPEDSAPSAAQADQTAEADQAGRAAAPGEGEDEPGEPSSQQAAGDGQEPAPEQQLAVAAVPGAGPQVMEAVPVAAGDHVPADAPAEVPTETPAEPPATAPEDDGPPAGEAPAGDEGPGPTGAPAADAPAPAAPDDTPADSASADGAPADSGPAPGYGEAEREALHRVMRERRDIRNGFRSDPIPHEVLLRVLEAAHTAPSVGHSQPWDFVIIRSEETRRTMHELAMRQREAYARSLPKGRAKQFKELKVEAILDTPVNIVVTADPTRGGRHTLGRHTQPQMAPYSSALAVENLWLAARAEGLGVGWVSFFDEREMVRVLGLPEHLEVVAYLCIGYVDAFPDEPELTKAGWSGRRPLSWVVHEEEYGRRVLPGSEPHDLLAETLEGIRPLDAKALGEAWERQKRMTKPSGAL